MSSTYPVQLNHPVVGTLNFVTVNFVGGWFYDIATVLEEEMESPGVDGQRWRTTMKQHRTVEMSTLTDATDYANAIAQGQNYLKCMTDGNPVSLVLQLGASLLNVKNAHIIDVVPTPGAGTVAPLTGTLAHLTAVWKLRIIDPGQSSS